MLSGDYKAFYKHLNFNYNNIAYGYKKLNYKSLDYFCLWKRNNPNHAINGW